MQEDYEESISVTLRTRSSSKTFKTQEENWKHQWLQPCLARLARKTRMERPVARRLISSLILRVSWKPVNPCGCVWKKLYRIIMEPYSRKGRQFTATKEFGTQIYSCASIYENSSSESSGGQGMRKIGKIPAWNLTKVSSKKEVIDEARTSGATVHFASLMDICHLKNAELETKHQKYKGRVVLRGDTVKDDSGSYPLNMDHQHHKRRQQSHGYHSKVTRMRSTSSRRSISLHPGENGRCTKIIENSKSECPDLWVRLPRH